MHDDAHRPAEPPEPSEPSEPRTAALDPRWRLAGAFLLVVAVSLALGLVAGTCWGGSPEPPLRALGLGVEPADHATVAADFAEGLEHLDPEQQAFAERQERELAARQAEPESGSTVPDFTDHTLVQELAGSWRLDLGRGRRGHRVRFGTDAVRTVHRQRFDLTLYDTVGRALPPYFTVLDLPDGKLLAFLDAAGTFRLVLDDVRRESDGRLSWRGPRGERRYGSLQDGDSPWRFDRLKPAAPPAPPVLVLPVPSEVDAMLYEEAERHLDEFAFGLMEHDADRVFALWDGRPDDVTRAAVESLLGRFASLRVWTRLLSVEVTATEDGPRARFEVVVTIQGAPEGARHRRDVELRDVRWRGRVGLSSSGAGVQLDPFPG